ncbi:MAG: DNA polymerase III subunit gamma/tau [Proteobacteria bacterium]|nr:DNA polymerase III subunit gamma/tau [Pseudomonadota bacterium]
MTNYQVLARKWRPKTFASLKGQEHVTRALINAITRGECHHAYLFTGTRGVGKTSLARILAKCFNCEQGLSATPCGECNACVSIDEGRFVDLIEVDAASRTRVEDTRELLENVQYAPTVGRYKIYLIDEVHMLSTHSFNALLKTLEEPPPHVKFILATTDPERIPVTVLSRCLRFVLKALSEGEIAAQLAQILNAQDFPYEERALLALAKAATGSMRDALSLLEQAIAFGNGALKADAVEEMLGIGYERYLPTLLTAIEESNVQRALEIVQEMALIGADYAQSLAALLQILHGLAIAQALKSDTIAQFANLTQELLTFKDKFSQETVQLLYQIGLMGQKDLPFAPNARVGFEMILLRMMVFLPKEKTQITRQPEAQIKTQITPQALPQVEPPKPQVEPPKLQAEPQIKSAVTVLPEAPLTLNWIELIPKLGLSGLTLMLVKNCIVTKWEADTLVLTLDVVQKTCLNAQRQTQIQEALTHYFSKPIKLSILIGEVGVDSPVKVEQANAQLKVQEANSSIMQDKVVQNILSTFDATVEKITVKE